MSGGGWTPVDELDHPVRVAILEALCWIGEPCSAAQLAPCVDERAATVNYHVNVLLRDGSLTFASKHPQRGGVEYRYQPAARP